MREGGSSARGVTGGCLAAVSGLAVRDVEILKDVARTQRVQLAVARWGLGACGRVCGRRVRLRGVRRRGEWDSGSWAYRALWQRCVRVMRTISVQSLCLAVRGIGWEGWFPGP
jgi:hypothetical protein